VREIRQRRGWTAAALAERCAEIGAPEITRSVIANLETGRPGPDGRRRRDVTIDELLTLAYALDVPPADLLGAEGGATQANIAITGDTAAPAGDVAAWLTGTVRTPVQGLLGGGLARCGSCGHALYLQQQGGASAEEEFIYRCTNQECPAPVARPVRPIDAYVTTQVLQVLQGVAEIAPPAPTEGEWHTLPVNGRHRILRALIADVTVSPAAPSGPELDDATVQIRWVWSEESLAGVGA
jgi:transcriptional regulator with XRE-family HTH domain